MTCDGGQVVCPGGQDGGPADHADGVHGQLSKPHCSMMARILARIGAFGCFSKFSPIVKPVKLIYFILAKS